MKNRKRILAYIAVLLLLLVLCVAGVIGGKWFISHEQRQNEDIEKLQASVAQQAAAQADADQAQPLCAAQEQAVLTEVNHAYAEAVPLDAYGKLAIAEDINLLIVGDSIGSLGWTSQVAEWIEENYRVTCTIRNISMGGNTSYAGYSAVNLLDDDVFYDLVIVCYGTNDDPLNFSVYYEALLRSLMTRFEGCSIISVLESSEREYTQKMQEIQTLAAWYGIPVADTIEAYAQSGIAYDQLSPDGTHPDEAGQAYYKERVCKIIGEKTSEAMEQKSAWLNSRLRGQSTEAQFSGEENHAIKEPYQDAVKNFDGFRYISSAEFTRESDTVWSVKLDHELGALGIRRSLYPGENITKITLDGKVIYDDTRTFSHTYSLNYIYPLLTESMEYNGILKLEFRDAECADAFFGIIFTGSAETELQGED